VQPFKRKRLILLPNSQLLLLTIIFVFYIEPDKKRQQQTDTTASNNLDGRLLSTARRSTLRFLWLKVLLDFVVEGQDESTTGASENVGESALEESA